MEIKALYLSKELMLIECKLTKFKNGKFMWKLTREFNTKFANHIQKKYNLFLRDKDAKFHCNGEYLFFNEKHLELNTPYSINELHN